MISVLEYAALSQQIYSQPVGGKSLSPHWQWLPHFSRYIDYNNPFYAQLHIKHHHNKPTDAVIVFRGSQKLDNFWVDYRSWLSDFLGDHRHDCLPKYFSQAWHLTQVIRQYLQQQYPNISLSLTGHSLGGSLAQLIPCITHLPLPVISFNALGIGNIPKVDSQMQHCIQNFNSRYGVINKVGKTLGALSYINVPNQAQSAQQLCQDFYQFEQLTPYEKSLDAPLTLVTNIARLCDHMVGAGETASIIYAQHSMQHLQRSLIKTLDMA